MPMADSFEPEDLAMFRDHDRRIQEDLDWLLRQPRVGLGVGGRVLESHEENGVTVIDSWELTEVSIVFDPPDKHARMYRPSWLRRQWRKRWFRLLLAGILFVEVLVLLIYFAGGR